MLLWFVVIDGENNMPITQEEAITGINTRFTEKVENFNPVIMIQNIESNNPQELQEILLSLCKIDSTETKDFGRISTSDIINFLIEEKNVTPTEEMLNEAIKAGNSDVVKVLISLKIESSVNVLNEATLGKISSGMVPKKLKELMEISSLILSEKDDNKLKNQMLKVAIMWLSVKDFSDGVDPVKMVSTLLENGIKPYEVVSDDLTLEAKENPSKMIKILEIRDLLNINDKEESDIHKSIKEIQKLRNELSKTDTKGSDNVASQSLEIKNKITTITRRALKEQNKKNSFGNNALHEAVFSGEGKLVEDFIANPSLLNEQNIAGMTPLHLAVIKYNEVSLLTDDEYPERDRSLASSRDSISRMVPTIMNDVLEKKETILDTLKKIIGYFFKTKAVNINLRDNSGKTPLDYLNKDDTRNKGLYTSMQKAGAKTSKELDNSWTNYIRLDKKVYKALKNLGWGKDTDKGIN